VGGLVSGGLATVPTLGREVTLVGQTDSGGSEGQDRSWEPMRLTYVGEVGEVLRGGGGKLSTSPGDPGEPMRKPPGGG
jgi:hypothetical protein